MSFCVPVLLDGNYEIQGLFSAKTTAGDVVVVTEKGPRFTSFIEAISTALQGQQVIGFVELDMPDFASAVAQLLTMDPSLRSSAIFIQDTEPLFDDLIAYFRSLA